MSHDRDRLADRFRGAMLGVAIGDALGAPVERGDRDPSAVRTWAYEVGDGLQTGEDTHMTLATARSLLACRGLDADAMASGLAEQYAREPWKEATGSWRVFDGMRTGERWERLSEELFGGTGSFGNGAAMRVTPFGLLHVRQPAMAAERARDAARITHAHPIGQDGAGLQAAAVAELVGATTFDAKHLMAQMKDHAVTRRFQDLVDVLPSHLGSPDATVIEVLGNGVEAHRSVLTALLAFLRAPASFEDTVLWAISLGGDADTIGSMAGALAGASLGATAIPQRWVEQVDLHDDLLAAADGLLALALDASFQG